MANHFDETNHINPIISLTPVNSKFERGSKISLNCPLKPANYLLNKTELTHNNLLAYYEGKVSF